MNHVVGSGALRHGSVVASGATGELMADPAIRSAYLGDATRAVRPAGGR